MAACLVEISHNVTNQVRLMNPFDHEVQIEQHAVLGEAEIVNCPRLIENIALPSSTNGCPSAPANVQDFFNCGCLSLGICLKAFVEITVLAAPVLTF
jgi:hypothetical protein